MSTSGWMDKQNIIHTHTHTHTHTHCSMNEILIRVIIHVNFENSMLSEIS